MSATQGFHRPEVPLGDDFLPLVGLAAASYTTGDAMPDTSTIARQTTATWEHADPDTPDYSHRPVNDEALRAALAAEQGMVMIDSHGRLCDEGGSLVSVDCDDRAACRLLGLDYDEVKLRLGL